MHRLLSVMLVTLLVAVSAGLARGDPGLTGRIAFVSNDGTGDSLYLMDAAGGPAWRVPNVPVVRSGTLQYPQWSQDGQWLTFCTEPPEAYGDIRAYIVKPDGTGLSQVPTPGKAFQSSLSPNASLIAFNGGWDHRLYTANVDGTDLKEYGLRWVSWPRFSPDGKSIAFNYGSLYEYDISTGAAKQIATVPSALPSWSPDSRTLAMEVASEIWTVNRDCSDLKNRTPNANSEAPAWTPDGKHIIFSSNYSGNYDLWCMDVNGSNRYNLTNTPGINERMPAAAITPVPEPVSLASGAIGLACVGACLRRRRRTR